MTTQQVADLLQVSLPTLVRYRRRNIGPPYVKLAGVVRYRRADVEASLQAATVGKPK